MKQMLFHIALLIAIHFLFLLPLLTSPFYQSHDGELHLARFAAYIRAFQDGHIPPRWAGDLNYGYGAPIFDFFAPLPGYIATGLHRVGLQISAAFQLIVGSAFMLLPVTGYLWLSQTPLRRYAFIGAILFGLAPYQFLNLYVRGDIGELIAFVLVPLSFLSIDLVNRKPTLSALLLGTVSTTLLILAHNGISLMFIPIIILYAFVTSKKKKTLALHTVQVIFALGISAYFWIPALFDQQYLNNQLFSSMFRDNFEMVQQIISKPWGFGTEIAKPGGLSPQIGPLRFLLALAALALCLNIRSEKHSLVFWFATATGAIFLSTSTSSFLWEKLPVLSKLQFPWRFVSLASFASIVLATYTMKYINRSWFTFLIGILAITASIPFAEISQSLAITDASAFSYQGTTALHGEATTRWTAGDASIRPLEPLGIVAGSGIIKNTVRKTTLHSFTSISDSDVTILDNTTYFPGWKTFVDNTEIPIQFQNPNHRGLITFTVPKGIHLVRVIFTETKLRLLADMISLFSLLFIGVSFLKYAYEW